MAKAEAHAAEVHDGKRLVFAGDGINDAPVLMRSDIGIDMEVLGSAAAVLRRRPRIFGEG